MYIQLGWLAPSDARTACSEHGHSGSPCVIEGGNEHKGACRICYEPVESVEDGGRNRRSRSSLYTGTESAYEALWHAQLTRSSACCTASVDPILFDSSLGASSADFMSCCESILQNNTCFEPKPTTDADSSLKVTRPAAAGSRGRPQARRRSGTSS